METVAEVRVRRTRALFVLVGVVGGVLGPGPLFDDQAAPVAKAFLALCLALSVGFLLCVVLLPRLLRDRPGAVRTLLYATMTWGASILVVAVAEPFTFKATPGVMVRASVGLLVAWYLLVSVRRLSADLRHRPSPSGNGKEVP